MDNISIIKARRKILRKIIKQDGCWLWPANLKDGYGRLRFKGKEIGAHRLSMIVFRNRPDLWSNRDLWVCHKCENKNCVNPEHLFVGDWLENAMDDVLRNPKVGKEFMKEIEKRYRERYRLRPCYPIKSLLLTKTITRKKLE